MRTRAKRMSGKVNWKERGQEFRKKKKKKCDKEKKEVPQGKEFSRHLCKRGNRRGK